MIKGSRTCRAATPYSPVLGRTLRVLLGDPSITASDEEREYAASLDPPFSYDRLLRAAEFAFASTAPLRSPWVDRALSLARLPYTSMPTHRYKPVARQVRPVATNMPNLPAQALKPITPPSICPLPTRPPPPSEFECLEHLTLERLERVDRALSLGRLQYTSLPARRYKPVARKVRPVATNMPDLSAQTLKPIVLPAIRPLPTCPPSRSQFKPSERLTLERLELILMNIPAHSPLHPQELDLLVFILADRESALAFTDNERGTFNREYFPDYVIPVIEHTPWVQAPIPIPKAIEGRVAKILESHFGSGRYEQSCSAYRSPVFPVQKKNGDLRLVHDLQSLNAVTIRDAALPPRPDDFAESFVGYACYGVADLFSGYDARTLDVRSRDLTTFQCMGVSGRCTVLPQGATNAVSDFVRCTRHILAEEEPDYARIFVDDCGIKGPKTRYDDESIPDNPGIRRFVYEFFTTFDRIFARFQIAGVTVSGFKLVPYTELVHLVGCDVSHAGWHLHHGIVSKVLKWPYPTNVSEVRCFLGIAGVARRWTKGFSLIARPLTLLCRKTETAFVFSDEARAAVDELKKRISSTPVLIKVDYEAASIIARPVHEFSHGLVVVAVDASKYGAGWVIYQYRQLIRHPALFGSCTYNAAESRYSQPKAELYGIFRALKELRTRIWGIHFLLESDAKFLEQMMRDPDLPNAPMTRWVAYLQLFDFTFRHIPAEKGCAQDALLHRPRAPDDSDESDGKAHLEELFGREGVYSVPSLVRPSHPPSPHLFAHLVTDMTDPRYFGFDTSSSPPSLFPNAPYSPSGRVFSHLGFFDLNQHWYSSASPSPSMLTSQATLPPLMDFYRRRVPQEMSFDFLLGDDVVSLAVSIYRPQPTLPQVSRVSASSVFIEPGIPPPVTSTFQPCAFGTVVPALSDTPRHIVTVPREASCRGSAPPDASSPVEEVAVFAMRHPPPSEPDWHSLAHFLTSGELPLNALADPTSRRKFLSLASRFFVDNDRLWRVSKCNVPQLVVVDPRRRRELIAAAHNDCGHRGRDATYRLLADRFYWPSLHLDVRWFVASCNSCQFRSRYRALAPLSPTLSPCVLRRFACDTIHMPDGRFLLHASCTTSKWPEAVVAKRNTSSAWARFFRDLVSRFGCFPIITCDGGKEFKGAARELLERHNIAVVISSPYNPKGNGIAKRDGATLMRAILKCCPPNHISSWPKYLPAALLAVRTTTSRATNCTPYFLVYGMNCLFPFDMTDRTWNYLDWHKVHSTEDLLALRILQLTRREEDIGAAVDHLAAERQRAIDDYHRRNASRIRPGTFTPGTWVLLHETWLDTQHGNKGALRWAGPFVVDCHLPGSGSYRLRELDGTVLRAAAPADRLKLFYFRDDLQSPMTLLPSSLQSRTADYFLTQTCHPTYTQRTCNLVPAHANTCQGAYHAGLSTFVGTDGDITLGDWSEPYSPPGLERFPTRDLVPTRFVTNIPYLLDYSMHHAAWPYTT